MKTHRIEISSRTIVFTAVFLIFLKFLWLVKDLIFSLLIAFIIMSAVRPAVVFLEKKRIPRNISAATIFVLFLLLIGYVLFGIIPPLIYETNLLIRNLPTVINQIAPSLVSQLDLNSLTQYLPDLTNQAFKAVSSVFSNFLFVLSTLFFSLYFTIEEDIIKKLLTRFFSEEKATKVALIFEKVEKRMSAWFWGELILMIVVGTMTFVGLNLIGLKYILPLSIVAGLLEIVPNIGPVTSAIPAIFVALGQNYFFVLPTAALYFVVQQLENNLIVPWVMKKAVGLNPIITLIALIVGGKIGGVLGVILAIPTTLFIETILIEVAQIKK